MATTKSQAEQLIEEVFQPAGQAKDSKRQPRKKAAAGKQRDENDDGRQEQPPAPACPEKGTIPIYFDSETSTFYSTNAYGEYQKYPEGLLNVLMRSYGFSDQFRLTNTLTYLENEKLRIVQEQSVHFAGPLGGFSPGILDMAGNRVLVTRGAKHLTPVKGEWPIFKKFLQEFLGPEAKYFLGWMKAAMDSLDAGFPFSPGQMLAIAGPPGAGKSFLQSVITPLLGGRVSTPYEYMTKGDKYNNEVMGAEHALIGDQNHKYDAGSRRAFGAAIKNLVVNPEQRMRGMHRGGMTVMPFFRVSLTVNDNPQSLLVLPEMDSDVSDKIILLWGRAVNFPFPSAEFPTKHSYLAALHAELPHFLYHLRRWKMPEALWEKRYGVISYKSPKLIEKMTSLSSHWKLWNLIEMYLFADDDTQFWEGTAAVLEKILRDRVKGENLGKLFSYPGACGAYLVALKSQLKGKIEVTKIGKNKNKYMIHRPTPEALDS